MSSKDPALSSKQFGGITVVLGGDFRQTLPVLPNAKKNEILSTSITRSHLWQLCKIMRLTENMRLRSPSLSEPQRQKLQEFAKWLLQVGEGTVPSSSPIDQTDASWITIPEYLLLPLEFRNLEGLISFVYDTSDSSEPAAYLCERAILAPTNEIAAEINSHMIAKLTTEEMSYYSSDTIDDDTNNRATLEALYPTEFLNTLRLSGLPDHHLRLKIGVPVVSHTPSPMLERKTLHYKLQCYNVATNGHDTATSTLRHCRAIPRLEYAGHHYFYHAHATTSHWSVPSHKRERNAR
ncbi:uncharacterized protein [Miscanthus floridulus]|uniref:uncharacterized protein n=1 Tax=Miscanthus floridulus TaxID=154761 RepID=UPI00345AE775